MSAVLEQVNAAPAGNEELHVAVRMTPEIQREVSATGALAVAQAYEVDCAEMAQALANERRAWAQKIDRIKAMRKDLLQPAKDMLAAMQERVSKWFDPSLADLEAARALGEQKLLAWDQAEKARLAREQAERDALARRLRQEAEAKAAAERARAEEQAKEARRKAEEAAAAQRKAEAEGNARAAAAAAAAAAKAEEQARAALENGEAKAQAATLEAAAQAQAAPVAEAVQIKGQATKTTWVAELKPGVSIEQAKLLIVEAIAGGRHDLLALLELDLAPRGPLHKLAAALKGAMSVPGFVVRSVQSIAGSRK